MGGWRKFNASKLINHYHKFYFTSKEILTDLTDFEMLTLKQH